jgi:hypothetical protein
MASKAEEFIRELKAKHGDKLTPQIVFESAKPDDSPIHGKFIWDEHEAWLTYNIERAKKLIASVKNIITTKVGSIKQSAFHAPERAVKGEHATQTFVERPRELDKATAAQMVIKSCQAAESRLRSAAVPGNLIGVDGDLFGLADKIAAFRARIELEHTAPASLSILSKSSTNCCRGRWQARSGRLTGLRGERTPC